MKYNLANRPKTSNEDIETWFQEFEKELEQHLQYCYNKLKERDGTLLNSLIAHARIDLLEEILGKKHEEFMLKPISVTFPKLLTGENDNEE